MVVSHGFHSLWREAYPDSAKVAGKELSQLKARLHKDAVNVAGAVRALGRAARAGWGRDLGRGCATPPAQAASAKATLSVPAAPRPPSRVAPLPWPLPQVIQTDRPADRVIERIQARAATGWGLAGGRASPLCGRCRAALCCLGPTSPRGHRHGRRRCLPLANNNAPPNAQGIAAGSLRAAALSLATALPAAIDAFVGALRDEVSAARGPRGVPQAHAQAALQSLNAAKRTATTRCARLDAALRAGVGAAPGDARVRGGVGTASSAAQSSRACEGLRCQAGGAAGKPRMQLAPPSVPNPGTRNQAGAPPLPPQTLQPAVRARGGSCVPRVHRGLRRLPGGLEPRHLHRRAEAPRH
jgi:hypothetical protein